MKFKEVESTTIAITDAKGLDGICVYINCNGNGVGRIVIYVFGRSWAASWAGMGENTSLEEFFLDCNNDYLIKNLSYIESMEVNDYSSFIENAKRVILEDRRTGWLSDKNITRENWDLLNSIEVDISDEWVSIAENQEVLRRVAGDEWWSLIPKKESCECVYLKRILDAIKECFKLRASGKNEA